ncbi:MAG: metallophosphoesterase [Candidatus Diapherotrites archaeon]|nr:metallophosphoesterase [Candidatus Diapherotrites archaeon]
MKLVHMSDFHVGEEDAVTDRLVQAIKEVNKEEAEAVIVSGDITHEGLRDEFLLAKELIGRINAPTLVVPGNHDAKNYGFIKFQKFLGPRNWLQNVKCVGIAGIDSSIPDMDEGHIGREKQDWLAKKDVEVVVLHHHLIPVPQSGRERDVVVDAGDVLKLLDEKKVRLVLSGHRHVCNAWKINNMILLNSATTSSKRERSVARGYNVVEYGKVIKAWYKPLEAWGKKKRLI